MTDNESLAAMKSGAPPRSLAVQVEEFWEAQLFSAKGSLDVETPGMPTMRLRIGSNELDTCFKCAFRSASACWFDSEGIVGYARAVLAGPRRAGQVIDAAYFAYCLDSIDQAALDFASLLMKSHEDGEPFTCVRDGVRWLADFRLLELHPSRRGRGLGVRLGAQFLNALRNAHSIGFFTLKPFPLQYSCGDGPREEVNAMEHPEQFARDKAALRRIYASAWGAAPLPGADDHLYVAGSARFRVCASDGGSRWWLQREAHLGKAGR